MVSIKLKIDRVNIRRKNLELVKNGLMTID